MPVARVNAVEPGPHRSFLIAVRAGAVQVFSVASCLALSMVAAQAQLTSPGASPSSSLGPLPGQGVSQVPIAPEVESASATAGRKSGKEGAPPRSYSLKPTFDSVLSIVNTSGQVGAEDTTNVVLQLRPGFEAASRSGRLRGSAIYFADASLRSNDKNGLKWQNSLNSEGSAELVPNLMYVDGRANVAQTARAAVGQQTSVQAQSLVDNIVEVASVSVSPYLRGGLADYARYEARWTGEATNVRKSVLGDFTNNSVLLRLTSPPAVGIGWQLEGSKRQTIFRAGRTTDEDRVIAGLSLAPQPDLSFGVRGGRENANVADVDRTSFANWGGSFRWNPSSRTGMSIDYDKRYFGQSYRATIEHRQGLSSFVFNASRNTNNNQINTGGVITLYDLLFLRYATLLPDPIAREVFVREQLRAANLDPNTVASGGFVSSGISVLRTAELGWLYTGRRTTYSVQAFTTDTGSLGRIVANVGNGVEVRQAGLNATALHRLTRTASGTLGVSLLRTDGRGGAGPTWLKNFSVRVIDNVNAYTTLSLGTRLTLFDSPNEPYREAALSAILVMRF
jgi:uncharacterized protein (PEP-CTERM system associated)